MAFHGVFLPLLVRPEQNIDYATWYLDIPQMDVFNQKNV